MKLLRIPYQKDEYRAFERGQRIFAQDDHVIVHLRVTVPGEADLAVVDIFRLNQAGMIAEHWDIVQRVPENPKNGNGMF